MTATAFPASTAVPFGRRAAARLVDVALVAALAVTAGVPTGFGVAWLVVTAVAIYAYFVVGTATGATLGKRLLGLRVVGPDGGPPTPGQAAVRELVTIVGAIPFVGPLVFLAGAGAIAVTASRDPEGQGVHDRWAGGTRVVTA